MADLLEKEEKQTERGRGLRLIHAGNVCEQREMCFELLR